MEELYTEIATLRMGMMESGKLLGLGHPQTIKISQELDDLLNTYMNVQQDNRKVS